MLKGTLHYKDEKFDITLFVYAKEVGSLQMYLKDNGGSLYDQTQAMNLFDSVFDGEKYIEATSFGDASRRLNIKESNGFQTNLQNMLFASRVASAIRYMYEYNERVGKTDDEIGEEKVFSSIQEFNVINCNTGASLGTFKKDRGVLIDVQLNMPYVQLSLTDFDERGLDAQYLTPLKQKDKFGNVLSATKIKNMTFKHDESLLGFKYISKASTAVDVQASILGMYENMEDVIAAHPEKSFTWIRGRKYEIVTQDMLEPLMAEFEAFDGMIAVDTETSGLNITFKSRIGDGDQLTGICMSKEMGTGYYFPLQMRRIPNLYNGDHNYFMQKYKKFFETKKFVTHNLAFDWKVFYIYDINLNSIFDTMLAYAVTERYKQSNFQYGLKALIHNIFGWDMIELSDFIPGASWGKTTVRFWDLPFELCRQYAPTDADMTLTLYNHVKKIRLLDSFKANKVFEIELKFAKCVAYSEFYGLHIDVDRLPQLIEEVETSRANCEKRMYEIAGETFNPNSPKQLQAIMYDKLGLPDVSHKRSTDKEALKELSSFEDSDGKPLYPFAAALKKYRDEDGIYKSFIKKRSEYMSEDGYIHAKIEAFGADTGRVSVNHPNYQSYNDAVKKFVSPRRGFKMWDSDFSQIEYRVLCSMAHEQALIDAFADPDMDYHTHQAARMFSVPYGAVTKEMRQQCKGINFGLPYGMGDESLGARIYGKRCKENTIKAADLRERYFVGQDNIRKFFDTVRDEGVRDGFTRTLFGRARYYHKSVYSEGAIRRQAGNHVIQGCISLDTKVQTKEYGIVELRQIIGETLHFWDGEQWTLGNAVASGMKQKCVVTFSNGVTITCSPEHKFLMCNADGGTSWVECKELADIKGATVKVVVNPNYCASEYVYTSPKSKNNLPCLSAITDRYIRGWLLGRVSGGLDGLVASENSKGLNILVRLSEKHLLPELLGVLAPLSPEVTEQKDLVSFWKSRYCAIININNSDLYDEIRKLHVTSGVSKKIFADTEVMRGFLGGLFDTKATVGKQGVRLTFGRKLKFCKDVQQALLFLGIKSNCIRRHQQKDVTYYTLSISKFDFDKVLDVIGLSNTNIVNELERNRTKRKRPDELYSVTVKSVKMSANLIKMGDICNTEGGYYIANGVITHNTAADLFKIACIRVFEMLEANGWLGKVLMDAFIHDEILGEVSEDINFFDFVREWRKAFEVPVEGFCKLYAGLGIGNSWYEAKKADWSPQFIQTIIDSPLRETWDNDGDKFIKWSKVAFDEYETQRVYDYLVENAKVKDTLTQEEKIIKPIIESYLKEKVDSHVIADNMENTTELERIAQVSGIPLETITRYGNEQKLAKDKVQFKEYKAAGNVPVSFNLQERLKLFCAWKGLNYEGIDIASADSVAITAAPSKVNTIIEAMDVEVDDMSTDDFILYSVKSFGFMLDVDTSRLILNFDMLDKTKTATKFLELFGKDAGNYRIYGMTFNEAGEFTLFETPKYVKSLDVLGMQMFLQSVANSYNKVV